MSEIKRDTARFDSRQWYVDGYARHFFTSEQDAKAALDLAQQVALNERRDLCSRIREMLPD